MLFPDSPDVSSPSTLRLLAWALGLAVVSAALLVPDRLQAQMPRNVITTNVDEPQDVYAADLDNDGDKDVLSASGNDGKIAWYENLDAGGVSTTQNVITTSADHATSVYAADLDNDGDKDVLSASGNDGKIAWYENLDAGGVSTTQNVITTSADHATSVYAADVDDDGDKDVLSASQNKIAWYENLNSGGVSTTQSVITQDVTGSVYAADLDGDGDKDVLSASLNDDEIAWYENLDAGGVSTTQNVILSRRDQFYSVDGINDVYAADVDNDGDKDVLSAFESDKVAWFENLDSGGFSDYHTVITTNVDARSVYAADVDNDNDKDVLSASDNQIAWYENLNSGGVSTTQNVIRTSVVNALSVYAADLDGDGDKDILSASWSGPSDGTIAWYENRIVPLPPPSLAAEAEAESVIVDWTASDSADVENYLVYRDTAPIDSSAGPSGLTPLDSTAAETTVYTDTSSVPGTEYHYRVTATDEAKNESGFSEEATAVPENVTPPSVPSGLAAEADGRQVNLTWDANSESDLSEYRLYRGTSPEPTTQVATIAAGTESYTDTDVSNGTTYYYRLTAVDTDGNESNFSNEVSATPEPGGGETPAAPTGLAATAGDGEVSLSWDANSESDLSEYRLYRGTSPEPTTQVATITEGNTTYDDPDVSNGTTYYYRLTAVDADGNESNFSNEVSATPETGGGDPSEIAIGGLTVYADEITPNGDGSYLASGNVSVDQVLQLGGNVTVNPDALTLSGDGALFLTDIADRGQVTLYDGEYAFELPNESSTVLSGTGLSAANSLFAVAGLDVHLGGLEILTGNDPGVRVEGNLELPQLLGAVEAEVSQLQITETEGLALEGEIEVGAAQLKNGIATLEELKLELNTVAEPSEFEGSAKLDLSALGAKIGASASLIEGMLQRVALDVDLSKPVPIPGTGMGLAGAGGEASGLEEGPPKLKISADLVPSAGGGTRVVSLEDLSLAYTFDTRISGDGSLAVFKRDIASAGLTVFPREKIELAGNLGVGSSVPGVQQDILSGNLSGAIQAGPPLRLSGQHGAKLVVPDLDDGFPFGWIASATGLPYTVGETNPDPRLEAEPIQGTGSFIGGAEILGGDILGIDTGIDFDFEVIYDQGSLDANFGKNLVNLNPENGFFVDAALENVKAAQRENRFEGKSLIVGAGRTNPKLEVQADTLRQRFQLREDTPALIIRVQADPKQPEYSVTTPAGNVYSSEGGTAVPGAGYTELDGDNKTFLTIKNPAQGEWSINLPDDGTEYAIDVIGASPAPTLDLAPPEESGASSVDLFWTANDPDDEVTVDLYYDNDQSGQDGVLIAEGLSEDQTSFTWNTEEVPTGTYHVYAVASTGKNAPVVEYAPEPVRLLAAGAPPAPTGVSASPADTALTIAWNGNSEADRYTVYYAAGKDPTPQSLAAGVGDTTGVSFGGIPPGRTYHLAVSATDTTGSGSGAGSESQLSEVTTVNYESQTENNAPRITTTDPARQVRESEAYQQPIAAEDADGEALSYELARGPEGMEVGSGGTVTWDPEAGRHQIKVRVQDPNGAADSLSYGLRALSRGDATAQVAFSQSTFVGPDATGQLTLTDPELDQSAGLDSQRVRVQAQGTSSETELLLRETQASSGTFRASFGFASSAEERPALDVDPVDTLQVSYEDPFPDTTVVAEARFFEVEPPRFAPDLGSPAPGALAVITAPTLRWSGVEVPGEYRLQVATDSSFRSVAREKVTSDTSLTVEGLEMDRTYFWRVRAETVTEGPWSSPITFTTRASKIAVTVDQSFGEAAGPEDYRLVALPGDAARPLGQTISGEAGTGWQAFWDDGSSEDYLTEYDGSDQFTFSQGRGFWLTSRQSWTVEDSVDAVQLETGAVASVPLHDGWNIISNPLEKTVAWSAVTEANGGELQPLWAFDGSFAQADTFRSATSGEAFYFLNDTGLDSLQVPYSDDLGARTKQKETGQGRLLTITAQPQGEEGPTSTAQIGFGEEAAEGLGRLDQPAPPGRFSSVSLRLKASGTSTRQRWLAIEQRPPVAGPDEGHTFQLLLQSEIEGPVQVTASGLDATKSAEVTLLRPSTGRSHDLANEKSVTLGEADSTALRLAVGSGAYVRKQEEEIVPDEVTIISYPNPMREQATLEYTLPEAGQVRLTIYDMLGRRVATLKKGSKKAGRYRVSLERTDLSSGVYFGRLKVGDQTRTHKITVVR
jgi:fibronectin type 3 domain-containing protein